MSLLTWLINLFRNIECASVDEIMLPLTRIHKRLDARRVTAQDTEKDALERLRLAQQDAHNHALIGAEATKTMDKLSALLPG